MGDRAVHLVLAHLCQQVDESLSSAAQGGEEEGDFAEEQTDREIFECILREFDKYEVNLVSQGEVQIDERGTTTGFSQRLSYFEEDEDGFVFVVYEREEASIQKCDHTSDGIAKVNFLGACIDTGAQKVCHW